MEVENYLKEIPEFKTERLKLRKLSFSDLEDVFAFCSNPNVSRPMTWEVNSSKDMTKDFLSMVITGYEKGESGEWAIEWNETGQVIGVAAFINWSNRHKCVELGYFLSEDYWGRGIATEALRELVHYGFSTLYLNRIEGRSDTDNIGSQKVMKKLGMKYEGTLRKNEFIKGEFRDTEVYSILGSEY
ncbi:alanine acetyltransferase [Thalassobacillus devorans]|uniref:Alanine acetyltransferase n=1 Tax=Thalassobacillus devorans TaxID=279813 RepID=A0ABQ1NHT3_9BACI|nr:GNAT family protein [Thalassobacillus devorans]NIK27358.1 ribosomal-protein-alanine N-acetyltransferase [Thalassobacillus devorans]GGC77101.1 alanine acetyltransferase [Thalassobacillus devorans]